MNTSTILVPLLLLSLTADSGAHGQADNHTPENTVKSLTLEMAQDMAERIHPQLAEARAQVEAAAGRAQQAGTFPNPEAIAGAQQIPFGGGGSNQREYVAGIAQPIPLGGRLRKAREVGELEREVRRRGLEATRRDLHVSVQSAFATALYQGAAYWTWIRIAENVERAAATTRARVEAGDTVPEDLARVEMELARARIEVRRSESMHERALMALIDAIGDPTLQINSVSGDLERTLEIPTLESLAANLSVHPDIALAGAEVRAGEARVLLAEAERIPDIKIEALYHRLEATNENTIDLGLSIPLPLFNRNQGRLREARAEAAEADARAKLTANELTLRLRESHSRLANALENARAFTSQVIPRIEAVLKSAELRYAAGDTSLADVLLIRRDWATVQLSYLESLREVMQAWAVVSDYLPQ